MSTLYDIPLHRLSGEATTLAPWRDQVLLIVNVASRCGLTPQYAGLQALHERHAPRGFSVLGFPCNDFLAQEPGSAAEIQQFCSTSYGVSFPLFEKVHINSAPRHPLYVQLIAAQPQAAGGAGMRARLAEKHLAPAEASDVTWNFEKFLIGRDGQVLARFAPDVTPEDAQLLTAIEAAL